MTGYLGVGLGLFPGLGLGLERVPSDILPVFEFHLRANNHNPLLVSLDDSARYSLIQSHALRLERMHLWTQNSSR